MRGVGKNGGGRAAVIGLSLTLHAGIGLLAVLGSLRSSRFDSPPAAVAVVFEPALPQATIGPPETASVPSPEMGAGAAPQAAEVPSSAATDAPAEPGQIDSPPPDPAETPSPALAAEAPMPPGPPTPAEAPQVQLPAAELAETPTLLPPSPATPKPARAVAVRPTPKPMPRKSPAAVSPSGDPRDLSRSPPFAAATAMPSSAFTPSDPVRQSPSPGPAPPAIDDGWRYSLAAWVRSQQRYPEDARRQGEEGAVTVRFTVSHDGKVLDAQLVQHGGSGLLEQAALAMLRGARAPAFPTQMAQQQVTITITIRYRLQD